MTAAPEPAAARRARAGTRGWIWWWGPVIAYMVAIFAGSSLPGTSMPAPGLWRFDKVLHAVAFAGLAALSWRALRGSRAARGTRALVLAVAIATSYGALDELHQRFTPHRSSDPADLLADFVGACLGAAFAALVAMWVRLRAGRSRGTP